MVLVRHFAAIIAFALSLGAEGQVMEIQDDFEPGSEGLPWTEDDVLIDTDFPNPFIEGVNTSSTVMRYQDVGGEFANVRFDVPINFDLRENSTFSLKIYLPSEGLTDAQPNQVSLKLQNSNHGPPWQNQTEIIKPLQTDEWQEVSFDFASDEFINFNSSSAVPAERFDFDRLLIQINGEGNFDPVTLYIDDFSYDGILDPTVNPTNSIYTDLVWADEFETDGPINSDNWFHQTILPNGNSWFNGELQHYTDRDENSFVEDGFLHIVAKNEVFTDQGVTKNYTSARLNSKFAFTYGRVVARAKMPFGFGTWPAIWMLGKNIIETGGYWSDEFGEVFWPACGEIDIMEHWGSNQNIISAALHTPSSFGATENYGTIFDEDVSDEFHIYEMIRTPDEISFSIDGNTYYTYAPAIQNAETWPFTQDQYLLLNVAIESIVSPAFEESEMVVDYVRVYQEGSPTSTVEREQEMIRAYPNPVKNLLTIESHGEDYGWVEIYSITGQRLLSRPTTGFKTVLSTENLPGGSYILKYRDEFRTETMPFVKVN